MFPKSLQPDGSSPIYEDADKVPEFLREDRREDQKRENLFIRFKTKTGFFTTESADKVPEFLREESKRQGARTKRRVENLSLVFETKPKNQFLHRRDTVL